MWKCPLKHVFLFALISGGMGRGTIKGKCQLHVNNLITALYKLKLLIAETSSFKICGSFFFWIKGTWVIHRKGKTLLL